MPRDRRLIYIVDPSETITSIDGPWNTMAASGGSPDLTAQQVLGAKLFGFIAHQGVRAIYLAMHDLVRKGRSFSFDYRCDSPNLRRDMRMVLRPSAGRIRYESTIMAERPYDPPLPLPATDAAVVPVLFVMCSFCKVYRLIQSTRWKDLGEIWSENLPEAFSVSHGICDACEQMMEKLLHAT